MAQSKFVQSGDLEFEDVVKSVEVSSEDYLVREWHHGLQSKRDIYFSLIGFLGPKKQGLAKNQHMDYPFKTSANFTRVRKPLYFVNSSPDMTVRQKSAKT